jgi:hypothetical protein
MPTSNRAVKINLLTKDPFSTSEIGKLLNWALSTGRYIVVFTEMIVILTFMSRFTLDRQLTDLNEKIYEKQAVLDSYGEFETKVRQIQKQAQSILKVYNTDGPNHTLAYVETMIPADIALNQLDIKPTKLTLIGVAYSTNTLSNLVNKFKNDPKFTDVILEKINSSEDDVGINFILTAALPAPKSVPINNSPSPKPKTK